MRGLAVAITAVLLAAGCHKGAKALPPTPSASPSTDTSAPSARILPPRPDGALQIEAEDFVPTSPGWSRGAWGESYYANTFGNSFLSRKAFLGAPPQCHACRADVTVRIPVAGDYVPLVRYEAPYRFGSAFRLRIEQGGQTVFERTYGARESLKVFPFGERVKTEAPYAWGATENEAWEGHDQRVHLAAGEARLSLLADEQTGDAGERNVDVVFLTRDAGDVRARVAGEQHLPLDGLLTQSGDVALRLVSRAGAITLTVPPGTEHSPYWVHTRTWKPHVVSVAAGATSPWTEVGDVLDSLNDGQWALSAASVDHRPLDYVVEIGVRELDGTVAPIARFEENAATLPLVYDADTRTTRRVRRADDVLFDLLAKVRAVPVHGPAPSSTLVYMTGFDGTGVSARDQAITELNHLLGVTAPRNDPRDPLETDRGALRRLFLERASLPLAKLQTDCDAHRASGLADHVSVISVGDEISLSTTIADGETRFPTWLRSRGITPASLGEASLEWSRFDTSETARQKHPLAFYLSRVFAADAAIEEQKKRTDLLRACYPHAGVGANFSPHTSFYLGSASQWITLFRRGGLTMPWTEDYVWTIPVASQQMAGFPLDVLRAGVRGRPETRLHEYVMPHTPGNTPASWRRQLYAALMHGAKVLNLFEARPSQAAYTENSVSDPAMYAAIRTGLHELSAFEDIAQAGEPPPASVALWYSQAGEIWGDDRPPFGAGKRTLWLAVRHAGHAVDIVDEEDALAGRLASYKVLFLTDAHVSRAATAALARWVIAGGRLVATAGAGRFDEANAANTAMAELLGVDTASVETSPIELEKQDLPFASPLAQATVSGATVLALGGRARTKPRAGTDVLGTFDGGDAAVTVRKRGDGTSTYLAFLPGLAYVKPALPRMPVDRTPRAGSSAHLLPTTVDTASRDLVAASAGAAPRPLRTSDPLVEAGAVVSSRGVVVFLVNWRGTPIHDLRVEVDLPGARASHVLATGGALREEGAPGKRVYTLDLDVADAIVLR